MPYALHRFLLALAVVVLIGCLVYAVDAGATEAAPEVCHAEVVERLYERPTELVEHQVAKHTRTKTKGRHGWSDWSAPEVWLPLSHVAWVTEIGEPVWQLHAQGHGWRREWAVLPTGATRTVPGEVESSGWTTESLEGWSLVDERTVQGEQIPCPAPDPSERDESSSSTDCESGLVTTVTRTWRSEPVLVGFDWVPGDEVLVTEASSQREATPEECPPPEEPPTEEPPVYECDGDGDGVLDHTYNDPTDGVCAEEVPPTPSEPDVAELVAAGEMLPVTGPRYVPLTLAVGAVFLATGLAICRWCPVRKED